MHSFALGSRPYAPPPTHMPRTSTRTAYGSVRCRLHVQRAAEGVVARQSCRGVALCLDLARLQMDKSGKVSVEKLKSVVEVSRQGTGDRGRDRDRRAAAAQTKQTCQTCWPPVGRSTLDAHEGGGSEQPAHCPQLPPAACVRGCVWGGDWLSLACSAAGSGLPLFRAGGHEPQACTTLCSGAAIHTCACVCVCCV